jgi:predicted alpha/beta hydrolase family esterase
MFFPRHLRLMPALLVLAALPGCVDITNSHRTAAQLEPMGAAQTGWRRAGHVYCILGWLGIWSRGMDAIAARAQSELGVHALSLGNPEWHKLAKYITAEYEAGRLNEPVVLVGHSIGADDQVRVARALNQGKVPVDLLLLIDPTVPPHIPPNVIRCVNLYKSHPLTDPVPAFRGVRVIADDPSRTNVENVNLRRTQVDFDTNEINHFNIAKIRGLQDMVLAEIAKTCPVRTAQPVSKPSPQPQAQAQVQTEPE